MHQEGPCPYLEPELTARLERRVEFAVDSVRRGQDTEAIITLKLKVARDPETEEIVVTGTLTNVGKESLGAEQVLLTSPQMHLPGLAAAGIHRMEETEAEYEPT